MFMHVVSLIPYLVKISNPFLHVSTCVCVTERDSVGGTLIGCLNRCDLSHEDDITLNTHIHSDDINSGSLLVASVCTYFDWPGIPSG